MEFSSFQVIDIWMLVSNFYPFIIVICHTIIHHIKINSERKENGAICFKKNIEAFKENEHGDGETILLNSSKLLLILERFSKIYLPALGICFVAGYWTFGCSLSILAFQ